MQIQKNNITEKSKSLEDQQPTEDNLDNLMYIMKQLIFLSQVLEQHRKTCEAEGKYVGNHLAFYLLFRG